MAHNPNAHKQGSHRALRYALRLRWNGELVMIAECSGVLAQTMIRHAMVENFAGETARVGIVRTPTLENILALRKGECRHDFVGDETGEAAFYIECISN